MSVPRNKHKKYKSVLPEITHHSFPGEIPRNNSLENIVERNAITQESSVPFDFEGRPKFKQHNYSALAGEPPGKKQYFPQYDISHKKDDYLRNR